jgi:hypothetical protein
MGQQASGVRAAACLLAAVIGGLAVAACSVNNVPPASPTDGGSDGGPGVDSSVEGGGGDAGTDGNICIFDKSHFGDGCVFGP